MTISAQAMWESLSPVAVQASRPPRGGVLVVTLLLLTLLALLAFPWLVLSMNESAQSSQYAAQSTLDGALDSGLEHAKACASAANADGSLASGPRESSADWVMLDSNAARQVRYRWTVADNASFDARTLPWPPRRRRLAARVALRDDGWQPVTDPAGGPVGGSCRCLQERTCLMRPSRRAARRNLRLRLPTPMMPMARSAGSSSRRRSATKDSRWPQCGAGMSV